MLSCCAWSAVVILALPRRARAETSTDDRPALLAFASGMATAGAGLAVGGAVFAANDSDRGRRIGIYVADAGLTLAPLVSHAMLGEWKRGVVSALPPAASSLGMVALLAYRPHMVTHGEVAGQYAFSLLLAATVFSSVFGVIGVLPNGEQRGPSVAIAPSFDRERVGIEIGGLL